MNDEEESPIRSSPRGLLGLPRPRLIQTGRGLRAQKSRKIAKVRSAPIRLKPYPLDSHALNGGQNRRRVASLRR
jgi:hypothetical protein